MKAIRKPLIPVSAALAAALFSNAASADLHIHKTLDAESIVVIGPEVEDLSVGQQLRVETNGSVGTVTRIRGQKALVSIQSTEQLSAGDRVVLARSRERAGVVPAESGIVSERNERKRSAPESASSALRFSLLVGGNRPTGTIQPYSTPLSQYAMYSANTLSYSLSLLPEAAVSFSITDSFRIQGSGSWVQKRITSNSNNQNQFNAAGIMNSQMQNNGLTISQNSFQTAIEAQYVVPKTPLILSAGPYGSFPMSANVSLNIMGQRNSGPIQMPNQKADIGALLGVGFSTPVSRNVELVGLGRYAHGTQTDYLTNQRTRDLRMTFGVAFSL